MRTRTEGQRRAEGLQTKTADTVVSPFLTAHVTGSAVLASDPAKFPPFDLTREDGETIEDMEAFVVLLDCVFPQPIEFHGQLVDKVPAWFNVNGTEINGKADCKYNGMLNAERSLYYLDKIGFDFSNEEAVIGKEVRVKLGLSDKGEIVADVCTHAGRGHDEASMAAGARAMAFLA